jgi:hypothetical protein
VKNTASIPIDIWEKSSWLNPVIPNIKKKKERLEVKVTVFTKSHPKDEYILCKNPKKKW